MDAILRSPHIRNSHKRPASKAHALTAQKSEPVIPVSSCLLFLILMAPLNAAGSKTPGSAASARRRAARNGMLHAGRRRDPGTTAGVIGPAAVAVWRSEGRCQGLRVRFGTPE